MIEVKCRKDQINKVKDDHRINRIINIGIKNKSCKEKPPL